LNLYRIVPLLPLFFNSLTIMVSAETETTGGKRVKVTKRRCFPKSARDLITKNKKWKAYKIETSEKCNNNYSMQIECNDNCEGREGCLNKSIQKGNTKDMSKKQKMTRDLFFF
jgi:hypothetical protein